MNIWFISKYASLPKYAKAPSRLYFLAKECATLGNEVSLITSDANHFAAFPSTSVTYNREQMDNVDITWVKTRKYKRTASIGRILSWINFEWKLFIMSLTERAKPDIVVVSSLSIFTIIYGYYLKRKFKTFLVFEVRDIWPLTMTEEGGFSKWHPLVLLIGWMEKFGYKKADLIVGTMPKLDQHVNNILGYEKPFLCSPLGFAADSYAGQNDSRERIYSTIPSGKIIVGYAGSMGITNALEPFVEVIKQLKNVKEIHFVLVGSGDKRPVFEQQLANCENVTFFSRIAQNEVKDFLSACDILYLSTHPSKVWDYGQSMNKVVEYMLASKPIIASYSGYQSMINEAQCGYFVPGNTVSELKEAILNVADMPAELRKEMGERGRKWIYENRQYSLLAKRYLEAIAQVRDLAKSSLS